MKKIVILVIGLLAAAPALFAQKAGRIDTVSHPSLYTCPMHDSILLDKPGNCPICGMKLELSKKEQMKKEVVKNYNEADAERKRNKIFNLHVFRSSIQDVG